MDAIAAVDRRTSGNANANLKMGVSWLERIANANLNSELGRRTCKTVVASLEQEAKLATWFD